MPACTLHANNGYFKRAQKRKMKSYSNPKRAQRKTTKETGKQITKARRNASPVKKQFRRKVTNSAGSRRRNIESKAPRANVPRKNRRIELVRTVVKDVCPQNLFNSEQSRLNFKSVFEAAPNTSKYFPGCQNHSSATMMESEANLINQSKCASRPTRYFSHNASSSSHDDSVMTTDVADSTFNRSLNSDTGNESVILIEETADLKKRNDSSIGFVTKNPSTSFQSSGNLTEAERDVLVISDAEDDMPWTFTANEDESNLLSKKYLSGSSDVICVDESPVKQSSVSKKAAKRTKLNSRLPMRKPAVATRSVTASSVGKRTALGQHSLPDLKIISEVRQDGSANRFRGNKMDCTARSVRQCQRGDCPIHHRSRTSKTSVSSVGSDVTVLHVGSKDNNSRRGLKRKFSTLSGTDGEDFYITSVKLRNLGTVQPQASTFSVKGSSSNNKENASWSAGNSSGNAISGSRKTGNLRPIVIDGSNVAYSHGQPHGKRFSCKGIDLCVKYFQNRGHKVTVFVPQYRRSKSREIMDQNILEQLGDRQIVVFTPSRIVDGLLINSYDDRFILDFAAKTGGVIVSNDNYRDIKDEKPQWREAVNERLLMYVFVGDHFMVPDDPLGRRGVTLDKFLSFPS